MGCQLVGRAQLGWEAAPTAVNPATPRAMTDPMSALRTNRRDTSQARIRENPSRAGCDDIAELLENGLVSSCCSAVHMSHPMDREGTSSSSSFARARVAMASGAASTVEKRGIRATKSELLSPYRCSSDSNALA